MPKRLNADDRSVLKSLVKKLVHCDKEKNKVEEVYKKIAPTIRDFVLKRWPDKDMDVLRKYGFTQEVHSFQVALDDGGVEQFTFDKEDKFEIPDHSAINHSLKGTARYGYYDVVAVLDKKTTALCNQWVNARKDYEQAISTKRGKYFSFIEMAKTFEQILEVWPEATQVSEQIMSYLPAIVSNDVLDEIRKDSAERLKQAAKAK